MVHDVLIIGSGPSGLTAAIYCARDNLKTLILGGRKWGGQLMLTTEVDNYPGFPEGILGPQLMENMKNQSERFGAEIKLVDVTNIDVRTKKVTTDENETYEAKSIILATGADTLWLNLPNEQKLIGKGVSSCAPCDAFFFKNKKVAVVGGGDAAMEEAFVLSKFATEVTIIHRRDSFRASKIMQDRTLKLPNVKVLYNTEVLDILGAEKVEGIKLNNNKTLELDGVFVAIGHVPNTKIFAGQIDLDEKGFIKKYDNMQTSIPGIFVAGDVHDHHYKQAITAAGFGCQSALEVSKFISSL